jgi:hypothetical protein
MAVKPYGLYARKGTMDMSYRGCMGYGMHFPANQFGGLKKVWGIREYRLSTGLWITRESTLPTALSENLEFFFASVHQLY